MNPARVSIAHLLDSGVPFTWNDAVAVAQAAAVVSDSLSLLNDAPSLVRSDTCFITIGGEVELPETDAAAPRDGVLTLLGQMLAGREAPADLLRVASGADPGALTALLTQFDVPDGAAQLAALARAALARRARPTLPSERLLLRRPASARAPEPPKSEPPGSPPAAVVARPPRPPAAVPAVQAPLAAARPPDPLRRPLRLVTPVTPATDRRNPRSPRRALIIAISIGALAVAGAWRVAPALERMWRGAPPSGEAERPPIASWALPGGLSGFVGAVEPASAVGPAAGASASPLPAGVPPPAAATSANFAFADASLFPAPELPAFTMRPPAELDREAVAPSGVAPAAVAPAAVAPPAVAAPAGAALPGPNGPSDADDATLFSSDDGDVAPPVLRAPTLPTAVGAPGSPVPPDWPYLTVVVDRSGAVEQVRLRAQAPRPGESLYRHQMLLAAAKAWRFTPALRDGRPVRYALRVPLEP